MTRSMCRLIESVKILNGKLCNIEAHNARIADSRRIIFGMMNKIDLSEHVILPVNLGNGLYKCRIIYAQEVQKVEFIPYIPKPVKNLRVVYSDTIQYEHKFLDRSAIENLLLGADADDILIVREGLITDTSQANVVFFDGRDWMTPIRPLLPGTKRKALIEQGIIKQNEIFSRDLKKFKYAALINAMLDIGDIPFIPIADIL